MKWGELPFRERVEYIKVGVKNGLRSLEEVKNAYHSYAEGGHIFDGTTEKTQQMYTRGNNNPIAFDEEGNLVDQVTGEKGVMLLPEFTVKGIDPKKQAERYKLSKDYMSLLQRQNDRENLWYSQYHMSPEQWTNLPLSMRDKPLEIVSPEFEVLSFGRGLMSELGDYSRRKTMQTLETLPKIKPVPEDDISSFIINPEEILKQELRNRNALQDEVDYYTQRFIDYIYSPEYTKRLQLAKDTNPEILGKKSIAGLQDDLTWRAKQGIKGEYVDDITDGAKGEARGLGIDTKVVIPSSKKGQLYGMEDVFDHEVGHAATGNYHPEDKKLIPIFTNSTEEANYGLSTVRTVNYNEAIANKKQPLDILRSEGFNGTDKEVGKALKEIEYLQNPQELKQRVYAVQQAMQDQGVNNPEELAGPIITQWNQLKRVLNNAEEFQKKALGITGTIGTAASVHKKNKK